MTTLQELDRRLANADTICDLSDVARDLLSLANDQAERIKELEGGEQSVTPEYLMKLGIDRAHYIAEQLNAAGLQIIRRK